MRRPTQPHELLEQELNILLQGQGTGVPPTEADGHSDGQSEDVKKRVRTIKNRLAAKRSREQARSYVQELESNLSRMRQQNEDLARRLALAEAENEVLKRGTKSPLSPNQTATPGSKNCDGEPAAGRSSLCHGGAVITDARKQPSPSKPPTFPGPARGIDPVARPPQCTAFVQNSPTGGSAAVHFAHVPQYTGVSANKKRKASVSAPAAEVTKTQKMDKYLLPFPLSTSPTALKENSAAEEPPQLVESPSSNVSASSPAEEGLWIDDVPLDNDSDPNVMLEQLMKEEPVSPLEGSPGFFEEGLAMWAS